MKIKGIIFDKDGTLFDFKKFWLPVADRAADYVIERLNAPKSVKHEMLLSIGVNDGINGTLCRGTYLQISQCFENVLKTYNVDCDNIEKITVDGFHENIIYGDIVPNCKDIENVFFELKKNDYKIFLATTDDKYVTDKCLNQLGISEYFDEVYTDDSVHKCKPDPYFIYRILDKYHMNNEELVMVGDTMTDMNFAHNGNIKSIGVALSRDDKSTLENVATVVIENISQLMGVLNEI